jgi:hypothetical protein
MPAIEAIRNILITAKFDQFLGMKEDLWFDAKLRPGYDLATPNGRIELAKDISALANSEGGHLIIGLVTEPVAGEQTEQVVALDLLKPEEFDVSKYRGIIRDSVYPEISGLTAAWIESGSAVGQGVGVLFVPQQQEAKKYFLMKRVTEDGVLLKQIVFGIARRVRATIDSLPIAQLYEVTQKGRSPAAERMSRLEDKVDSILRAVTEPEPKPAADTVDERIKRLLSSS